MGAGGGALNAPLPRQSVVFGWDAGQTRVKASWIPDTARPAHLIHLNDEWGCSHWPYALQRGTNSEDPSDSKRSSLNQVSEKVDAPFPILPKDRRLLEDSE